MATKKKRNLVIVESPAKARTLAGILGRDYDVRASIGHVRDLPKGRLGVDVDNGFAPTYLVPKEKREVVRHLKEAADGARAVYLATDPDREGEAISWHVVQAAELNALPNRRVVFHEITPEGVRRAFDQPREIDMRLVDSQQARRIVDRLVGYKISPILWRKVRRGLSAGRVQSVALRMVVERQREIDGFVPREYWTIDADLTPVGDVKPPEEAVLRARLVGLAARKKKLEIGSADEAERLVALLQKAAYQVVEVRRKKQVRRPAPPFITSTLQQEASRRFGFSAKRAMAVAQQLYEGRSVGGDGGRRVGLITYMRTDSTRVADVAKSAARAYIREKFGAEFLPHSPRVFQKKVKGAQEAHEAIRPTSVRRDPAAVRRNLTPDQHKLYSLIWQRMVASQMADAVFDNTTVEIEARPAVDADVYLFRATDSTLRFPGYRRLYRETGDEAAAAEPHAGLPPLESGDELRLMALLPEQHFTEPPPRFTEATLVKALEENGIGRPSTYAPILSTIQDRGYVEREGRQLKPTELGYVVNDLLVNYFAGIVDMGFTAEMEEELDQIAEGQSDWRPVVEGFYGPLVESLTEAAKAPVVEELTNETCEKCGRPMVLRWGRYGRFLACSGFPECQSTKPVEVPVTEEKCELCGAPMAVKGGRYGPFLACTRYPECKGRRRFLQKVGVACPDCGGDLVEKRAARSRRVFYGCANYPRCRFTSWTRPLPGRCPDCGGLLVADGRSGARCRQCSWRGSASTAAAASEEEPLPAGVSSA